MQPHLKEQARGTKRATRKTLAVFAVKSAIVAVLLGWLIASGSFSLQTLLGIRFGFALVGVFVCQALMLVLPLVRWHLLLRAQGLNIGLGRTLQIGFIGYFAALFLPNLVGVDGTRIVWGSLESKGRSADLVSTVVIDRALGLMGLVSVAILFGAFVVWRVSHSPIQRVFLIGVLFLVALVGSIVALCNPRLEAGVARFPVLKHIALLARPMQAYRQQKIAVVVAFVISVFGHMAAAAPASFAFRCLDSAVSLPYVFAITPVVNLAGMIAVIPLGLGVADSVAEFLYPVACVHAGPK